VLAQAQAVEARKAERAKAGELRAVLKDMRAAGEACDVALALLVEAGNRWQSLEFFARRGSCGGFQSPTPSTASEHGASARPSAR
jgi:hypothetical protein